MLVVSTSGRGAQGQRFSNRFLLTRDTLPTRRHWFETVFNYGDVFDSTPQGRLVMSQDFVCQNWGGTTDIQWVKTNHPTMHRQTPQQGTVLLKTLRELRLQNPAFKRGLREGSQGALQEQEEESDSSDEMFPTIPSGSQFRKTQGRGVTEWLMERININVCLKAGNRLKGQINGNLSFAVFNRVIQICPKYWYDISLEVLSL